MFIPLIKSTVLIFLLIVGCSCAQKKSQSKLIDENIVVKENCLVVDKDSLKILSAKDAEKKYGLPIVKEEFVLNDLQGEFRNNIVDKYTLNQRLKADITIMEYTWCYADSMNITIWYEKQLDDGKPKAHLIWQKGMEF